MGAWKRFQKIRANLDDIRQWYGAKGTSPLTGLGLVCGKISGNLELFEFDGGGRAYEPFKAAARRAGLGPLIDRLEAGYAERTPTGGRHLFYRCEAVSGNTTLAEYQSEDEIDGRGKPVTMPLIETRGEGGYVVVAPSHGNVHPNRGRYELLSGSLSTIPTITPEEREALFDLARSFDQLPRIPPSDPHPASDPHPSGSAIGSRPGDDFNARATWPGILEPHGWKAVGKGPDGETNWRRPGKSLGVSATTGHCGDWFYPFTTSSAFEAGRTYTKYGAYTILNHGGDYRASAKALRLDGYGSANGRVKTPVPVEQPAPLAIEPEARPRPVIAITTEEHIVIDQAVKALGADPKIFQRGNVLVHVVREVSRTRSVIRAPGSPRIMIASKAYLRDRLTQFASWVKQRKTRNGDVLEVPAHPPDWLTPGVAERREWDEIRGLEAIVESPVLRLDGTILDSPGHDEDTGLLFEPNGTTFPPIPSRPTQSQALAAAGSLLNLVADFPFAGDEHRAAWLASLLTPLARFGIAGPCPLFLFDANAAGSGKTLLCDLSAMLATGRECARTAYPPTNEEMDKRILAVALAGYRMILFDNLETGAAIGGAALDAALTGTSYNGRILCRSEMANDVPLYTVWFATGNNLGIRGDALRRIVPCRLESPLERPEERNDFRIGNLLEYVRDHRGELVAAALTILRAHAAAGRPRPDETRVPMGYPAWEAVIRTAVAWVCGCDPCATREGLRSADDFASQLPAILEGWSLLCQAEGKDCLTAAAALQALATRPDVHANLREILLAWSRNGDLPSARSLGKRLREVKGRVSCGRAMDCALNGGNNVWFVRPVRPTSVGGFGGYGGSDSPLRA